MLEFTNSWSAQSVSVQLPAWADIVGWSVRDPRVVKALVTGYPRFMIPHKVTSLSQRIASMCLKQGKFKGYQNGELFALTVSTYRHAIMCQHTLRREQEPRVHPSDIVIMKLSWDGTMTEMDGQLEAKTIVPGLGEEPIFAITHPTELQPAARFLWQHTGFGISSRRAEFWLVQGPFGLEENKTPSSSYGPKEIGTARAAIRNRIGAGHGVPEENVFLYAGGMAAITETAMAIQTVRGQKQASHVRAVVFGFVPLPWSSPSVVDVG